MQLNFNFNGKTLLRNWWKIVEANFRTIQTAFADHLNKFTEHKTAAELDHPDKSVQTRHIADYAIGTTQLAQDAVNNVRISNNAVDTRTVKDKAITKAKLEQSIQDFINNEPQERKEADENLQRQIDEVTVQNTIKDLYGKYGPQTAKIVVSPQNPPELYFDDEQQYYGEYVTMVMPDIKLYLNGKLLTPKWRSFRNKILTSGTALIYLRYYPYLNECELFFARDSSHSPEDFPLFNPINDDMWDIALYAYDNINVEFKVDSSSPTGDRYELTTYDRYCASENADSTGSTYTITGEYEIDKRTLDDLKTKNKDSFLDAVNENTVCISKLPSKDELYGEVKHTYKIVLPKEIPESKHTGFGKYELSLNYDKIEVFVDGKPKTIRWDYYGNESVEVSDGDSGYLNLHCYLDDEPRGELSFTKNKISRFSANVFGISLYYYLGINYSRGEPEYKEEYTDAIGDTYNVELSYTEPQRSIDNLVGSECFLDAVNENTAQIATLKQETLDKIDEIPKRRASTIVIGTSTAGYTASDVDYLCDGTDDQEEINQAIASLPVTGGKILLLNGIYSITAKIDLNKSNVTIEGMGNSTKLRHRLVNENHPLIELRSCSYCKISNMYMHSFNASTSGDESNNYLISVNNSNYITISDMVVFNSKNSAIRLIDSGSIRLYNNTLKQSAQNTITVCGCSDVIIENNILCDTKTDADIDIISGDNIIVSNNLCLYNRAETHSVHLHQDTYGVLMIGNILSCGTTIDEGAGVKCEGNLESP